MEAQKEGRSEKLEKIDKILRELDAMSGQSHSENAVVNIAAILQLHSQIEERLQEKIDHTDIFDVLANRIMKGGVIVLTDESTTGQAVSVEFRKKIEF